MKPYFRIMYSVFIQMYHIAKVNIPEYFRYESSKFTMLTSINI